MTQARKVRSKIKTPTETSVIHFLPLAAVGGCEVSCLRLIQGAPDLKHRVVVFDEPGEMTARWAAAGIVVEHLGCWRKNPLAFLLQIRRWSKLNAQRSDNVIFWSTARLAIVLMALYRKGARWVVYLGNPLTFDRRTQLRYQIYDKFLKKCDGVTFAACSRYVAETHAAKPFFKFYKTEVIYNPVRMTDRQLNDFRRLDTETPVRLGMVARLDPIKDHDAVLRAIPRILARYPNARFEFAGDGSLRSKLIELAERIGVNESVRFLGEVSDVEALITEWDVFLYSTTANEGLGSALIEAQAVALPCVVSDLPMMREAGGDDGGCVYFRPGDAEDLAATTIALLASADRRRALGACGRARAAQLFSPAQIARRYLQALRVEATS